MGNNFLSKQNKSAFFHLTNETKSEGSTSVNNVTQLERGGGRKEISQNASVDMGNLELQ